MKLTQARIGYVLLMIGALLFYGKAEASGQLRSAARGMTQQQGQIQGQIANGGNVEFNDRLQLPNAPGLSSGSSNSSGKHRIYKQRQGSFLLGGWTNIDMVLALPEFIGSNPTEDQKLGACVQDAGYREFRLLKFKKDGTKPCPQDDH